MSREATTMMSGDTQTEISSTTSRNSPGIIEYPSAILPEEIWDNIFKFTKYRDILALRSVSKHFNAIATRVLDTKYMWYELCRKKVPERHWCTILENAQHPVNDRIDCENFHDEKEFSLIWSILYSSWIEWSTMIDKEPDVKRLAFNDSPSYDGISVDGNILAVHSYRLGVIDFYDILQPTAGPIYSIPCPRGHRKHTVSKKGPNLTATLGIMSPTFNSMTIEKWNVESKELIYSKSMRLCDHAFVCESFGYLCTITSYWRDNFQMDSDYCLVEIRQVASIGSSQSIRLELEAEEFVFVVRAYGDTLMLLTVQEDRELLKLHKISIRECQLKETHETSPHGRWRGRLLLFQPCVIARCYYDYDSDDWEYEGDTKLGFSVSGREWKFYDATRDLNFEAPVVTNAVLYESGVLALLMMSGNVHLIYVDDPDDLDSNLETLPSKIVTLNWDNLFAVPWGNALSFLDMPAVNLRFTKYNSKIYLIIVIEQEAIILEF